MEELYFRIYALGLKLMQFGIRGHARHKRRRLSRDV